MKLYYHRNKDGIPNFGDDLNPWLWKRLLPSELDEDPETMFLGIGTLLNDRLPAARARVVFGTGFGIGGPPAVSPAWTFYAVRGPHSAKALGLAPDYAVTDPAILVSLFVGPRASQPVTPFAYMPHYRNAGPLWKKACERIGFGYIDPRERIEKVMEQVQGTGVLLAEAMHGAIIADTLRVPWIAMRSRNKILRLKWDDWCLSMEVPYQPQSTLALWEPTSALDRLRLATKSFCASAQLLQAARARPMLSGDAVFERRRARYIELLEAFRSDVARGRFPQGPRAHILEN